MPVRAAVFVPRKNWIVTGSDDMQVRVFNYNTLERAHAFEAHSDYVRCIVVHPTQPYILTSSGKIFIIYSFNRLTAVLIKEKEGVHLFIFCLTLLFNMRKYLIYFLFKHLLNKQICNVK